jgi:hypothetical protein
LYFVDLVCFTNLFLLNNGFYLESIAPSAGCN